MHSGSGKLSFDGGPGNSVNGWVDRSLGFQLTLGSPLPINGTARDVSPVVNPRSSYALTTSGEAAWAARAFATSAEIQRVVTDLGRVIGSPSARAATAWEQTPSARDTLKSTV